MLRHNDRARPTASERPLGPHPSRRTPPGFQRSSTSRPASPFYRRYRLGPFTIPHDAADPVGFVFRSEGVRMGYATDLGYIPPNVKAQLQGSRPAAA